ncbi:hypothetical protein [Pseudomonas poae]|uniref:Uncharacterized protein n=1 Tax=Pseudomonas poae TaxID=200451 RepID=A0A2S9EVH6_9PSED|nr:hypothetical protein [Pseudomonas poae]PRA29200.1 hypothetical protein CQZ97_12790 [Pseudomonas poae]PRC20159.1 hypothetical protein CQZ99_09250 [Pseudomonas poae]
MPDNSSPNDNLDKPYDLLTQLTTGPSHRDVAAATLRSALKEQYPDLDIDPDLAMVVTPRWRVENEVLVPAPPFAEPLTTVLARQMLTPEPVIYIDSEHFLTQQDSRWPVHLPVKIDAIGRLINELSPLLYTAFQEQQLEYWNADSDTNGPRWKVFANSLRAVWNIPAEEHWSAQERAMAGLVLRYPDKATRAVHDPYNSRACLIDVDLLTGGRPTHIGLLDLVVLIGEHQQHQMVLAHSPMLGYERYDSLEQLGEALPAKLSGHTGNSVLAWRLYEPPGDIFDHAACSIIDLQIQAIGALEAEADEASTQRPPSRAALIRPDSQTLSTQQQSVIRQVGEQLPSWLSNASDLDISSYSRHAMDLAEMHTTNNGRSFDDGIAPIRDYAREQLKARFGTHTNGKSLNLDKVEIRIESPVIWGSFAVPGQIEITRRNLIDLTLENLTGLPTGQASVHYNGGPAPEWLTYDYIKGVIESIDVGQHYPALIKRVLLDDPVQSTQRQMLFAKHLRIQLPLLALQLKIQRNSGIDDTGYRYIAAVVQANAHDRHVEGQEIVIRPLAFAPASRNPPKPDVVANMFVIGAKNPDAGPSLLYRPLLEPTLLQYPSRQNLIYAIKHSRSLRDSVLAWLPEDSRFNYAQFVFPDTLPSPWVLASFLVEPQVALEMSGPVSLTDEVVGNDALGSLYKANVNAMVELATRQSVSTIQKRWATYRETGWMLFNAALPFLGGTVGAAAWIWQIMDDLQEAEQVENGQAAWAARVDLLLSLGMALTLHLAQRQAPAKKTGKFVDLRPEPEQLPIEATETVVPIAAKPIITQLPSVTTPQLPAGHQGTLNSRGALSRNLSTLATTLNSFKLDKPVGLGAQITEPGPYRHLYPLAQQWFAVVGERWFEVTLDGDDNVIIVDSNDASRTGPLLITNLAGQWFVDLRLRLRLRGGGGFKKLRRLAQSKNPSRIDELRAKLTEFDASEKDKHKLITDALDAIRADTGPSSALKRQAFITQVDQRLSEYEVPIRQLRSLAIIDSVPNYQRYMVDYLNKQLLLTMAALKEQTHLFDEELRRTQDIIENQSNDDPKRQGEAAQTMADQNRSMMTRTEFALSRYRELQALGAEGARAIRNVSTLTILKMDNLKTYQITLSRYLCIVEGSSEAITTARAQFYDINDTLILNVQSLLDALDDTDSALDERLDVLNSLVEQFANVDQRLLDVHSDFPEQVKRVPLQDLRLQLEAFNQRAMQALAGLLREKQALTPSPPKAAPATRKKIIKTRFKGVQIGEPNPTNPELVDIKAPMTGKVIATFHEKQPGVWVERESASVSPRPQQSVDLQKSINTGQTLLNEESAATQRSLALSNKPGRIPVEIEEIFHQHAARLDRAQEAIESALTQLNLTEVDRPSAAEVNRKLNDAAQRLYALGTSTRASMIKQQPPTAARLEWLHSQAQIKVAKVGTRRRLKGPGKDYLDEYEVRDLNTQQVLWYAHFHYASPESALGDYVAGHLKTLEQRKLGGAFQRTGLSDREQIAIYRSEIGTQLAQSLFFSTVAGV